MLHFMEGFEIHQSGTYLARKWAASAGTFTVTTPGRLHGSGMRISGTGGNLTSPSFGVQNTWVVGFGFRLSTSVAGTPTVTLLSGASQQVSIVAIASGGGYIWRLMRGASIIESSVTVRELGTWYYVELKATVRDGTDGEYELRVDEVTDISDTGVNIANTGTDGADVVKFGCTSTNVDWDDIYILDNTGGQNDDFLGDSTIRGILPTAEGNENDWVPSTGTNNAALVDDLASTPNDADYVRGVTVTDRDLYAYDNLTGLINGPIAGIMVTSDMRMETTGTADVKVIVRQGGVNRDGSTHTVNGTPVRGYTQVIENSPDDSAPWEVADLDNMELGIEKVS
jgi:hypothetical protein